MPKIVLPISLQIDKSIDWDFQQNKPCWLYVLILLMPTDQKSEPMWVLLIQSALDTF